MASHTTLGSRRDDPAEIIAEIDDVDFVLAIILVDLTIIETTVLAIEGHIHVYENWLGLAKAPNLPQHAADRIGVGVGPFIIDAGNADWGTWVQILGSTDTPIIVGSDYYELHRLTFTAVERDLPYFVQFGFGASGADAITNGTYTEMVVKPTGNQVDSHPMELLNKVQEDGTLAWARCLCPGQDTGTMSFYYGLHEYVEA